MTETISESATLPACSQTPGAPQEDKSVQYKPSLEKVDSELPKLIERLERYGELQQAMRPDGIHCSDLVLCLRQSAYRKLDPKKPTVEQLGFYVDGNTSDRALKNLFLPSETECARRVWITPDSLDEEGNIWEFKATRSNNGLASHFGRQLAYYLALSRRETGFLLVRRLNHKYPKLGEADRWQPFEIYRLEISKADRVALLAEIEAKRALLQLALDRKDPTLAPRVKEDPELSWCCRSCLWKEQCWKEEV